MTESTHFRKNSSKQGLQLHGETLHVQLRATSQYLKGTHEKNFAWFALRVTEHENWRGLLGTVNERLGCAVTRAEAPTMPPRNGQGIYGLFYGCNQ